MPKKRVIGGIIVKDGWAVQSIGFERYLPVGRPEIVARFFSSWGADEIVMLDIDASREKRLVDLDMVGCVASQVFVPMTVGGGIRNADHVREVVQAGGDKVAINLAAFEEPEAVRQCAEAFGNQCIVGVMDVRKNGDGHAVCVKGGKTETGVEAGDYAGTLESLDVGEILVQSVDRDGARTGFDLELVDAIGEAVACPVIVMGGAGNPDHLYDALSRAHVSAAVAGNYFNYTEHAIAAAKSWLRQKSVDVRLDTRADYSLHRFSDIDGRLEKRSEAELADEIFEFLPEEVI